MLFSEPGSQTYSLTRVKEFKGQESGAQHSGCPNYIKIIIIQQV